MRTHNHPRYKRVIAGAIWAVAIATALFAVLRPQPASGGDYGLKAGAVAPEFELKTPDGKNIRLSDFAGRPVMIHFWATWCPACRVEMPDIEAAYRANQERRLVILAVNQGDSKVAVQNFRDQYGLTFPILSDERSRVANLYRVIPLPTTYFIDSQGVIRSVYTGQLRASDLQRHLAVIAPGGDAGGQ